MSWEQKWYPKIEKLSHRQPQLQPPWTKQDRYPKKTKGNQGMWFRCVYIYIWLVVSNISYFPFHNMGCHPSHWQTHIFQKGGSTTNQIYIASSSSDMGGACRGLPGEADNLLDKILKILGGIFRWKTQNIQNSWAMVAMDAQRSPSCKRCVF